MPTSRRTRGNRSSGGGSLAASYLMGLANDAAMTPEANQYYGQRPGDVDYADKNFDARRYTTNSAGVMDEPFSNKNTGGRQANAELRGKMAYRTAAGQLETDELAKRLGIENAAAITKEQALIPILADKLATEWHTRNYGVSPTAEWLHSPEVQTMARQLATESLFAQKDKIAADRATSGNTKAQAGLSQYLAEDALFNAKSNAPYRQYGAAANAEADMLGAQNRVLSGKRANSPLMQTAQFDSELAATKKPQLENTLLQKHIDTPTIQRFGNDAFYSDKPLTTGVFGSIQEGVKPMPIGVNPDGSIKYSTGTPTSIRQWNADGSRLRLGSIPMAGGNGATQNFKPPQTRLQLGVDQSLVNQPTGVFSPASLRALNQQVSPYIGGAINLAVPQQTMQDAGSALKEFYIDNPTDMEFWKKFLYYGGER